MKAGVELTLMNRPLRQKRRRVFPTMDSIAVSSDRELRCDALIYNRR
jgi:hypothetical protein